MAELIADPFRAAHLVLHLRQEGVTDDGVVQAMEVIDRGAFVDDEALARLAFEDCALPIPCGQIIPRPAATGHLLQALQIKPVRQLRLLLIGAGSGYTAALASQLCADVFAVERFRTLTETARKRVNRLGLTNIAIRHGDGLNGWPERGPYDRILLTGAVTGVPESLLGQLARGGRIVAPVASSTGQDLLSITSEGRQLRTAFYQPLPPLIEGVAQAL
jgi:protein-L-isoaspartate(D-aspartate) O-methyltransferase